MKVSKTFRWEAAHRLPQHPGECRNLHGHSYSMRVALDGPVGPAGMVIDFKDVKRLVAPLIEAWDHATLIAENDSDLLDAASRLASKTFLLPYETTAENLCLFAADYIEKNGRNMLESHGVTRLCVRIHETETCYAEVERAVGRGQVAST